MCGVMWVCVCDDEEVHVSNFCVWFNWTKGIFLTIEIQRKGKNFKNENYIVEFIYNLAARKEVKREIKLQRWKMFY